MPWPDVDIRIVDLETGTRDLPYGEAGELIARGPRLCLGTGKTRRKQLQLSGMAGCIPEILLPWMRKAL